MKRTPNILRACVIAALVATPSRTQTLVGTPAILPTAAGRSTLVPFAIAATPALLRKEDSSSVAGWVVPSRWGLAELRTMHALVHLRSDRWSSAVAIASLTMERYTELAASGLCAIELTDRLALGITFEYTFARARGFAAEHAIAVNAHALFVLDSATTIAIAATNLAQMRRAGSQSGSNARLRIGIGRTLGSDVAFDADVVVPIGSAVSLTTAVRWDAFEWLGFRIAYATVPQTADLSLRLLAFDPIAVLATLQYHTALGIGPTVGVQYRW